MFLPNVFLSSACAVAGEILLDPTSRAHVDVGDSEIFSPIIARQKKTRLPNMGVKERNAETPKAGHDHASECFQRAPLPGQQWLSEASCLGNVMFGRKGCPPRCCCCCACCCCYCHCYCCCFACLPAHSLACLFVSLFVSLFVPLSLLTCFFV